MFQLIYLRFTQPRADPAAVAAQTVADEGACWPTRRRAPSFAFGDGADRGALPEPSAAAAADAGDGRQVEPRQVAGVLQGPLRRRQRLHVRLRRQLRSARRSSRWSSGISAACRRRTGKETWKDVGVRTPTGVDREDRREGHRAQEPGGDRVHRAVRVRTRRSASRSARWRRSSQSRLLETIREDLGGTYSITAERRASSKIPRPDYTIAIQFGCDPQRDRRPGQAACSRRSRSSRPTARPRSS